MRYILKEYENGSFEMEITFEKQFEFFHVVHKLSDSEVKKFRKRGKEYADELHEKLSPI